MATPWASKRLPKMLRATYLADQEFLLEETRASKFLYFPGPVLWTAIFAVLAYLTFAPSRHLPDFGYYTQGVDRIASYLPWAVDTVRFWLTAFFALLALVGFLWIAVRYVRWVRTVYAVTNRRVIVQRGIVERDFDEIPVTQVRGVDVHQSIGQRFLGYGTVRVSSEGGSSHLGNEDWKGIPKPFKFQKLVEDATVAIQSAGTAPATATGAR